MHKLTLFLRETMRTHTKDEFYNTLHHSGQGTPWLYLRVLLLVFFSVIPWLILFLFDYYMSEFEAIVPASIWLSVTYLMLAYELTPGSEFKFWRLLFWGTIGGLASIFLVVVFGEIFDFLVIAEWQSAARAGIGEELFKSLATILILVLLKKKKPADGLLVGLAVGAGFAFFENIMYLSWEHDLSDFTATFFARNFALCVTHMFWTGAIGYAYNKLKKPLANLHFYVIVLVMMVLHTGWDLPDFDFLPDFMLISFFETSLWQWIWVLLDMAVAVIAYVYWFKERKKILAENATAEAETEPAHPELYQKHFLPSKAVLATALLFIFSMCVCLYSMAHGYFDETLPNQVCLGTYEEFIRAREGGKYIIPDFDRPFNTDSTEPYEDAYYEKGVLESATERVYFEDGTWLDYYYEKDADGNFVLSRWIHFGFLLTEDDGTTSEQNVSVTYIYADTYDRNRADNEFGVDYILYFDLDGYGPLPSIFTIDPFTENDISYYNYVLRDGNIYATQDTDSWCEAAPNNFVDWLVIGFCVVAMVVVLITYWSEKKKMQKENAQASRDAQA